MFSDYLIPILAGTLGLVMLCVGKQFISVIIIVIGLFLIASGIYVLLKLGSLCNESLYKVNVYVRGCLSVIVGIICIVLRAKTVDVLCICLGIFAILEAVSVVLTMLKLKEQGLEIKQYITEAASMVVAAIILFLLPKFGDVLLRIAGGVIVLLSGVIALNIKRNQPIIQEDAEVVDED